VVVVAVVVVAAVVAVVVVVAEFAQRHRSIPERLMARNLVSNGIRRRFATAMEATPIEDARAHQRTVPG
jgi:hypothetical protein